jgi:hypothetical protein
MTAAEVLVLRAEDGIDIEEDSSKTIKTIWARHHHPPHPPAPTPTPTPSVPIRGTIAVVNLSSQLSDSTLQQYINAVKQQADNDISKAWTYSVNFVMVPKGQNPPAADAYMAVADTIDAPGAAGYHDWGPNGEPIIKIDVSAGDVSVTISHEVAETISDWNAATTEKTYVPTKSDQPISDTTAFVYIESADATEEDTYQVNGVAVSNFVTRQWFQKNSPGPWDHLGLMTRPLEVRKGGYMAYSTDNITWTEVDNFSKRANHHRGPHSRYTLYKKPFEARKKSTFKIQEK